KLELAGAPRRADIHAASGDRVLDVSTLQQEREIPPRMIVQRAILIRMPEVMQIDVEDGIARDDEPAPHIRIRRIADQHIGLTSRSEALPPLIASLRHMPPYARSIACERGVSILVKIEMSVFFSTSARSWNAGN